MIQILAKTAEHVQFQMDKRFAPVQLVTLEIYVILVRLERNLNSNTEKYSIFFSLSNFQVIDPCDSNPCKNDGTCDSSDGQISCSCQDGFTGHYCESSKKFICCLLIDIKEVFFIIVD